MQIDKKQKPTPASLRETAKHQQLSFHTQKQPNDWRHLFVILFRLMMLLKLRSHIGKQSLCAIDYLISFTSIFPDMYIINSFLSSMPLCRVINTVTNSLVEKKTIRID